MAMISSQSSRSSAGLLTWMTPIPHFDYYLLAMRWIAILGVGLISLFSGSKEGMLVNPITALVVFIGYNFLVSIFIRQNQPLSGKQVGWLLLGDVIQAILATPLTGGDLSSYYFLFLLAITEAALAFQWRTALALIATIDTLQVMAIIISPSLGWDALSGAVTVARFITLLIVGALVTLFSDWVRREDIGRRAAAHVAIQTAILNEISLRFGEGGLNLERILAIILEGIRILPDVAFGLVLLPDMTTGQWQVSASTTRKHSIGETVADPGSDENGQPLFLAGAGSSQPLPDFVAADGITQIVGVRLILPAGNTLGMIVLGRRTDRSLSSEEEQFLRTLALEAGLAVRNATLYAQEQDQVDRLRRFETLQSTFFSAVGHELKTPLTVLKTLVPSLRQLPQLPAEVQAEITTTIEQNLARLESLITDLMESSRLEANAITLHPRPLNLPNRIERLVETLSPLLERKQQQIKVRAGSHLPPVWADGKRVEQILSNLVHNAVKFGPPGSAIEIEVGQVNEHIQISVSDAGPGVPPDEQERIFDKFYSASKDNALAGAGLGLFICRELVRLHSGRIWVEDRPGGGSRFCFTLPIVSEEKIDEESEL
jgi:K+-sensing histidine kinase KdpD